MDEIAYFQLIHIINEAEQLAERPRRHYNSIDPFQLTDHQFIRLFRLNKELTNTLTNIVSQHLPAPSRTSALTIRTKVLITLRFLATGSYQMNIGSDLFLAKSQSSVSRSLNEIVDILNRPKVFNEYVRYPRNLNEMNILRNGFYQQFSFPGVIGCLDCTHVAITPPSDDAIYPEHSYINRKGYHSINVQLICDWKLKILNVNARYPGSCHDSYIWNNCNVLDVMQNLHANGHNDFYLLGDSGYALRPWCLTPLEQDPLPGSPEEAYNRYHRTTRNIIERCNGVLKMRFRCLLKHRVLHYSPNRASKIINACVVLHNMCIENNMPEPEMEADEEIDFGFIVNNENVEVEENVGRINPLLQEARNMRQRIIVNYFTNN